MQSKTTVSYHNTSTRMAKIKKMDKTNICQGDRATGIHTVHVDGDIK